MSRYGRPREVYGLCKTEKKRVFPLKRKVPLCGISVADSESCQYRWVSLIRVLHHVRLLSNTPAGLEAIFKCGFVVVFGKKSPLEFSREARVARFSGIDHLNRYFNGMLMYRNPHPREREQQNYEVFLCIESVQALLNNRN